MFILTTATKKIRSLTKRIRIVQGGTSASKTISILIYLIHLSQTDKTPKITSIVGESFPFLRRGAIRDFLNILKTQGYFKDGLWDITNSIYTFETGSKIEFFSVDQSEKVRGARRDRLFINEANNISFESFEELEVRTNDFIYLDFNPTNDFWAFQVERERTDTEKIILTYRDNEALQENIIKSIEQRRERTSWWKVYGEGQLGTIEGRIFTDWAIINQIPHEARLERYGLDFGYTNDPSSLVAIYYYNGGYIVDEILYATGMSNRQIATTILECEKKAMVVADSSEPKSIDEIRGFGVNIMGVEKKRGETKSNTFVKWSIGVVQNERISITSRSTNVLKDYRNYCWETDKDGHSMNVPAHEFSHGMDSVRYALVSIKKIGAPVPEYTQKPYEPASIFESMGYEPKDDELFQDNTKI